MMTILMHKILFGLTILLLFTSLATYIIFQSSAIKQNPVPMGDDVAYLETSIDINEGGGLPSLITGLFSGYYREANRHPLYLAILSPFAQRDQTFFAFAKGGNFFIGMIFLLLFSFIASKQIGFTWGVLLTAMLSTNYFFVDQVAKVSVEPLLMIFCLLVWYRLVSGIHSHKDALLLGILFGFAYLSKITAVFLLPAILFVLLVKLPIGRPIKSNLYKLDRLLGKRILIFTMGTILVVLPLLWRNTLVYHNPFYNANARYAFIKDNDERRLVEVMNDTVSINPFETYSLYEFGKRIGLSLMGSSVVLAQLVFYDYQRIRGGVLILILLLLTLVVDKKRQRSLVSVFIMVPFLVFYVWYYQISSHYRYILPIFPIILINLGVLASQIINLTKKYTSLILLSLIISATTLSVNFTRNLYSQYGFTSPFSETLPSPRYQEVLTWMTSNIGDNRYYNGPGHDYQIEWLANTDANQFEVPYFKSFTDLLTYSKENNIKYLILTKALVNSRKEIFNDYFDGTERQGIIIKNVPDEFKQVFKDRNDRIEFIIYEII